MRLKEDGTVWLDCAKPGCKNGQCLRLNSIYCYTHSNTGWDKLMKIAVYSEPKKELATIQDGLNG